MYYPNQNELVSHFTFTLPLLPVPSGFEAWQGATALHKADRL